MATLESLQAKIKKLEQQAEILITKQASGVIEKIRGLMEKHGLTTADIDAHTKGMQRGKKGLAVKSAGRPATSVARFRDPKTGATWSGQGRAPQWIAAAKSRDKFLIDASAADSKTAPLTTTKATAKGNYVRGPQPAMYRDPKSGATWSGRGRAPAWLATVRDRSRFLIDGPVSTCVSPEADGPKAKTGKTTAQKASVSNAVARRAAAKKVAQKEAVVKRAATKAASTVVKTTAVKAPAKKSPIAGRKATAKATTAAPARKAPAKKAAPVKAPVTAAPAPTQTEAAVADASVGTSA